MIKEQMGDLLDVVQRPIHNNVNEKKLAAQNTI